MIKRNQESGFTLIETLLLIGILAIVVYSVTSITSLQNKMQKVIDNKDKASYELSTLVARGMSVIKDIGPDSNQGLCKFLEPRSTSGGVGDIDFVIHPEGSNHLGIEWERAFVNSGWKESSNCRAGLYSRCFELDGSNQSLADNLRAQNPQLKVELIPVELRTAGGKSYTPIAKSRALTNARDTGMVVSVTLELRSQQNGTIETVSDHNLMWSGEVSCRKIIDGREILISVSGMGSGLSEQLLLSSSKTQPAAGDKFMNVEFRHEIRSSTEMANGLIQANRDYDKSFAFQCAESEFRCPNKVGNSSNRVWVDVIKGRLWASYNPRNSKISANTIFALNQVCFGKKADSTVCPQDYLIFNNSGEATNFATPLVYTDNRTPVDVTMPNAGRAICPSVCSVGSDVKFNRRTADLKDYASDNLHRAFFRTTYQQDTTIEQYDADPKPIGCVCCFKKQCQSYGLNAMGGCELNPIEPMDARVPECQTEREQTIVSSIIPSSASADKCVVADLTNNGLVLSTQICSTPIPAACFFQGSMVASKNIDKQIRNVTFEQASEACYDMGQVVIQADSFREYLRQQPGSPTDLSKLPPVNPAGKFDYIDNAYIGTFIEPYTEAMLSQLASDMRAHSVQRVWMPMRTDSKGKVYHVPFTSQGSKSAYVNFNHRGVQSFDVDNNHPFRAGSDGLLLVNHRRWLGALPVGSTQTLNTIFPICRARTGGLFKSRLNATSLVDAEAKCRQDGGIFLPPENGAELVQSLELVDRNHSLLPWPVANTVSGSWLAFAKNATGAWEPRSALETTTGAINVQGRAVPFTPSTITHLICVRNGNFEISRKQTPCSTNAGLNLSAAEKAEIAFLIFKTDGWSSTNIYSLQGAGQ